MNLYTKASAQTLLLGVLFIINLSDGLAQRILGPNGDVLMPSVAVLKNPLPAASGVNALSYHDVRELSEINDPVSADAYPWISPNGLTLYYTKGSVNAPDSNDIVVTSRPDVNSNFIAPRSIKLKAFQPAACWLSADERDLYFTTGIKAEVYYSHRNTATVDFPTPQQLTLDGTGALSFIGSISLDKTQNSLFIYSSGSILQFKRSGAKAFDFEKKISHPSNYSVGCGSISKDGNTAFLSALSINQDRLLYQMQRLSPTDTFDVKSFEEINGINDIMCLNSQASASDNLEWIVFMRATQPYWESDQLFIARTDAFVSLPELKDSQIKVFPNPSHSGVFTVLNKKDTGGLVVLNQLGEKIIEQKCDFGENTILDLSNQTKGLYYLKCINSSGQSRVEKIVIQ